MNARLQKKKQVHLPSMTADTEGYVAVASGRKSVFAVLEVVSIIEDPCLDRNLFVSLDKSKGIVSFCIWVKPSVKMDRDCGYCKPCTSL